jgi:hypothetical protein
MPAIDLARLRKQANRLADFFFIPDEFIKHLREILEFYVNYTLRSKEIFRPPSNLKTYRTPSVVLRHIENELRLLAENNPTYALELADELWVEGALETRLLAAYLLGRIPPQEGLLLVRISAWTQQVRDPQLRTALLSTSMARMRKETPDQFFILIREWFHPARTHAWSNGVQALIPMITDKNFQNLPPIFDMLEPVIQAASSSLQLDLEELILSLYKYAPNETVFFLTHTLENPQNPMTVVTFRRMLSSFPPELQSKLRPYLRLGFSQQRAYEKEEKPLPIKGDRNA